jgi:hypothetical protein
MTSTTKLGLFKPADSDYTDVALDIDAQMDAIDLNVSTRVCTSGTRPSTPYAGQIIYETNTRLLRMWDGSDWLIMNPTSDPGYIDIAEAAFSGISTLNIDVTQGGQYAATDFAALKLILVLTANSAAESLAMRFNGDTASDYEYMRTTIVSSTAVIGGTGSTSSTSVGLGSYNSGANYQNMEIDIFEPQGVTAVGFQGRGFSGTAAEHTVLLIGGRWVPSVAASIATINLLAIGANTFTGRYWLMGVPGDMS